MADIGKRRRNSGNIFEDLGFDKPEEWKTKAHIAAHILRVIEDRGLTQTKAANVLGVSQPEVSNLKTGQLDRFTIDRLFRFLAALGQHVDISIVPQPEVKTNETITVKAQE